MITIMGTVKLVKVVISRMLVHFSFLYAGMHAVKNANELGWRSL